jgi:hypothetical protein
MDRILRTSLDAVQINPGVLGFVDRYRATLLLVRWRACISVDARGEVGEVMDILKKIRELGEKAGDGYNWNNQRY